MPTAKPWSVMYTASPPAAETRRGDAEVGDDRLALVEQDVFRLDVPVDDAEAVGVAERGGDRPGDPERDVHRELAFANEPVAETSRSRRRA